MGMVAPVYYTADMVRALSATTASPSGGCTKSVESQGIGLSTARSAGSRFGRRPPNFRPWSGNAWCGTPQVPERRSASSSASCSGRSDGRYVLEYGTACHHCIDLRDGRQSGWGLRPPQTWRDTRYGWGPTGPSWVNSYRHGRRFRGRRHEKPSRVGNHLTKYPPVKMPHVANLA